MFGAIIGDIVGSRFEGRGKDHKSKDFELFHERCRFTDDTVMTVAIGKALLECEGDFDNLGAKAISCMQEYGKYYPACGYGKAFCKWLKEQTPEPYNSYGNGAAMRVSGCAYVGQNLDEVKLLSRKVTEVTHNHPEGIKGAEATVVAAYLAWKGEGKENIRAYINEHYYSMDFSLDEIRVTYRFSSKCQESVPQALMAFFESTDFEDAIRNAVSLGGDSDTIAAIAGSVAEAHYGVPDWMKQQASSYLNHWLLDEVRQFEERYQAK